MASQPHIRAINIPEDVVANSFTSPEVRFSGGMMPIPTRPPNPWNPRYVEPIYLDKPGPFELPPDQPDEWQKTGRKADAGRRRYSAYGSYCNRDGPRLMAGLHPSRSGLRTLPSIPAVTLTAHTLEARHGIGEQPMLSGAADALECRGPGYLTVHYSNGRSRAVKGAFQPDRRPFSGLKEIIPPSASAVLEGNPVVQDLVQVRAMEKEKKVTAKGSKPQAKRASTVDDETLMDQIVTELIPPHDRK